MTAVAGYEVIYGSQVVIGVDTHQDEHVAVPLTSRVCASPRATPQRSGMGMGRSNGGPGSWVRFAPSGSRAPVPTAPDWPGS